MAVFHCRACDYLKTVDDKYLGQSRLCPRCKASGGICDPKSLLSRKAEEPSHQTPAPTERTAITPTQKTTAKQRAIARHQDSLRASALYVKARDVNEGMHRFHKYLKLASYGCIGLALWVNDFADNWVGYLCNKVDNATQSTLWSWTAGWFTAPPPAITPMYRTYNLAMTVLGLISVVWVSRWFFWTMLMMKLEDRVHPYKKGDIHKLVYQLYGWWLGEYLVVGVFVNLIFRSVCPFTIPWLMSLTTLAMAMAAAITVGVLEDSVADAALTENEQKSNGLDDGACPPSTP